MTLDEVKDEYGTSYRFNMVTGWSHSCYRHWEQKGFIPIKTQMKLEELTGGKLKASLDDLGE